MVPRRAPQPSPALAAEREQVVRAQRRQLSRAHRIAAADQEVAKAASVPGHRRFGEPSIPAQETAVALGQLLVARLVRDDRGDVPLLAQHHPQMRQSPADRFFSTAPPAAVTSTPRQMTARAIFNELVIANLVPTPPLVP